MGKFPTHNQNEIFKVPLMRCNLRTVISSIWTVCEVHGPYKTLRTETIVSRSVTVRVYWTTLVVFDQYWENSIKGGERQRWGASVGLEVQIGGPATPVPRQWGKYIVNPKNKVWLKLLNLTSFTLNTNFLFRYRQFEVVIDIFCV